MDTLDKGKHCSEEYCHQLDYLPVTCNACLQVYCADHFKYEAHNCTQAKKLDYKIPVCELCAKTVEFKRGKDLDLCLAEHMSNCRMDSSSSKPKGKKHCSYRSCKTKEGFRFECESCKGTYCVRHRMPEVHSCFATSSCSSQIQKEQGIVAAKKYPIHAY